MNDIPSPGEVFRGDDGTVSTILPSNYGLDYEASDGELDEYAEYIGIDTAREPELMWIAREGLRAALPDGWRACQTDENEVYYFNFQTGESLWDHPMDEHYKTQVANERSKRRGGGGGGGVGAGGAESGPLRAAPVGAPVGATKAIAESFFLKPAATASLSRMPGFLPNASATNALLASAAASEGASLPRAPPDVSDILSLAGSRAPSAASTAASGVARFKESEAALRKRLEEENGLQLRNLRIELEKKVDAERQRLAEAKTKLQGELDRSWEAEKAGGTPASPASSSSTGGGAGTATQRRLQLAREVKQIEESWKARLHDVTTRVRELQQSVEAKQQAVQSALQQTPEDLRKTLEARNAAELAQLRATREREGEVALSQLQSEHALALTEARRRANDAVAAAEKAGDAEMERKAQERRAQNAAMVAALQTALAAKQAVLGEKEKAAASVAPTRRPPSPSSPPAAPSREDEATVAAAQTVADADVAEAKRAGAAATTRLREEYAAKKAEKEAALRAAQRQQQQLQQAPPRPLSRTSTVNSALASPTSSGPSPHSGGGGGFSGSVGAVSPADQAKLDEEDRKLRDEADRAARVYEEETQLMVANKEAGRLLTAAPLPDVAATVSPEAIASLARSAAQEQRARDAENTRHAMAMKQLEAKHEQAVRTIKAQHDKALAAAAATTSDGGSTSGSSAAGFHPRQHPSFNAQLTARKQAWLRENPAPTVELPKLPPVPTLPVATMQSDMVAVQVPDEAEQAKLVKTRLAQVREELQRQYDHEAQALRKGRETGLEEWRASYRATRLAEVEKTVAALQAEAAASHKTAAETATAQAMAQGAKSAATAAADAAAAAAEARKLEALRTQRSALDSSIAEADGEHARQTQAMQARIAGLEASLAELRAQELREETTKARLLHQQRQHPPPPQQQHRQAAASKPSAADASAAAVDPVLYIADAEAAAEEAALRARWAALLTALRNAVQREMEAYEQALVNSSSIAASTAATTAARASYSAVPRASVSGPSVSTPRERGAAAGGGLSSLPPTAPPAPATTAMLMMPGHGAEPPLTSHLPLQAFSGSLSGFTTPLQRPPRDDSALGWAMPTGGAAGAFAGPAARQASSSPSPQLYLSDPRFGPAGAAAAAGAEVLPVQRALLSPSPQPQLWPGAGAGAAATTSASALGHHVDARQRVSVPAGQGRWAMPAFGLRGGSLDAAFSAALQAPPPPDTHGRVGVSGPGDADKARARRHAAHLSALQQTVRARRRELQAQRLEMEELREEWRADMHACKQHGDRAQAQQLRSVKDELEVRARSLNEEVVRLKEMQERVHEEVRRFRQWSQLREQQLGMPPDEFSGRRPAGSAAAEAEASSRGWSGADTSAEPLNALHGDWARHSYAADGAAGVMSLLQSVVDRTERLEEMLLLSRLASHSCPSPAAP